MIPDGRGAKLPLGLLAKMHVDKRGGMLEKETDKVRLPERNSH